VAEHLFIVQLGAKGGGFSVFHGARTADSARSGLIAAGERIEAAAANGPKLAALSPAWLANQFLARPAALHFRNGFRCGWGSAHSSF